MIVEETPIVMHVTCPACGAAPGRMCREFGRTLVAHVDRVGAAQRLFEETAVRLRAELLLGAG